MKGRVLQPPSESPPLNLPTDEDEGGDGAGDDGLQGFHGDQLHENLQSPSPSRNQVALTIHWLKIHQLSSWSSLC